jgi:hypothetical protein
VCERRRPIVLIPTSAEEAAASGTHRKDQLELASRDLGTTAPLLQLLGGLRAVGTPGSGGAVGHQPVKMPSRKGPATTPTTPRLRRCYVGESELRARWSQMEPVGASWGQLEHRCAARRTHRIRSERGC